MKIIDADHAATTKLSPGALKAMMPYLTDCYGNPSSTHPLGQEAARAVVLARETIARCLHALPWEISFTSGGSESDNQALRTGAAWGRKQGKRTIITSVIEHHAILHTADALEKEGMTVVRLPVGKEGILHPEQVARAISDDTCLVSIMAANNELGTLQPVAAIGRICRDKKILFHTDAVQAAGHIPIDVTQWSVDLLSLSAHKFHGPKGIGVLFARSGIEPAPLILGGEQERGRRAGTENVPAIVGLAAALEEASLCMAENARRVASLRDMLEAGLLSLPGVRCNGDRQNRLPGTTNLTFAGIPSETLLPLLGMAGICASAGSACASGSLLPSHVLKAIGLSDEEARSSIRFSLGEEITCEDISYMIQTVKDAMIRIRPMEKEEKKG
jgi:cysteine desulfurase